MNHFLLLYSPLLAFCRHSPPLVLRFYDSAYRYSLSSIFYGDGGSNLICACGSQNEIAVEVEEHMSEQAQTEYFWLGQQEGQQGNGRAGLGCSCVVRQSSISESFITSARAVMCWEACFLLRRTYLQRPFRQATLALCTGPLLDRPHSRPQGSGIRKRLRCTKVRLNA